MDDVYASLAYNSAPLLRIPVCVSRALLVMNNIANKIKLINAKPA